MNVCCWQVVTYIHAHTCCDTLILSAPFNKLGQIMDSLSCWKTSWWMFSYISVYLTSSVGSNSVSKLYKATPINHFNSIYHPNKNMTKILNFFWHSKLILLISEHPVWTSQHRPIVLAVFIIWSSKMIQVFFIGLPMPSKALYDLRGCVKDPDSAYERNKPLWLMAFVMQRALHPSAPLRIMCVCVPVRVNKYEKLLVLLSTP